MINDLISIIIPVKNNNLYIVECMESVLRQTYPYIEVILVDDASSPQCAKLYDSYKSEVVKVIHLQNAGGVSHARNIGISHARGEFIVFVDSDDIISQNYCEYLLNMIKATNSEISACGYKRFRGRLKDTSVSELDYVYVDRTDIWNKISGGRYNVEGFLWNKMFRAQLIGGSLFDEQLSMCEDQLFVFEMMKKCNGISVCSNPLYFYRENMQSVTHQMNEQKIKQSIDVAERLIEIVADDRQAVEGFKNNLSNMHFRYCVYLASKRPMKWAEKLSISRLAFCENYKLQCDDTRINKIEKVILRKSKTVFVIAECFLEIARQLYKTCTLKERSGA